jgi:DNA invertase Pin-like site-specific DNA recombinase
MDEVPGSVLGVMPPAQAVKVKESHMQRATYIYVRQSTMHQVVQNTESSERQYALQQRAVALGWPVERVHVIDSDMGQSGASAVDRAGFQQLVTEVSLGRAGLVAGLEVSRLARNSADWQRLLELCALTDTLILDEDGLYDCNDFNDRMLLGLKGTLSEAELHFLRARLQGGIQNKARRGELVMALPVGLVYDEEERVRLDPDQQVQKAVRLLFATFARTGSAHGTVTYFAKAGLEFPRRLRTGLHKGELVWGPLGLSRVLQVLHNPRYAGAFCYGRRRTRQWPDGSRRVQVLPREEWQVLLPDKHEGYISWEEFEENQRRLQEAAQAYGKERRKSPPREGPALLQGLVICGVCGGRMTVRYHVRQGNLCPDYVCQKRKVEYGGPSCQQIPGRRIDEAMAALVLGSMTEVNLDIAMAVQEEVVARQEEASALRAQQVARVEYEAELAGQRYRKVDPNNRLVAGTLEAEWNEALGRLQEAQREYARHVETDRKALDDGMRARIKALTSDFPRVWHAASDRDRKRLLHLLVEDVTLLKQDEVTMHVRFRGGANRTLRVPLLLPGWKLRQTRPEVVAAVDELLNEYTEVQIAEILTERGYRTCEGTRYLAYSVGRVRRTYGLASRYERLRNAGLLTREEMAARLSVSTSTVNMWRKAGLIRGYPYNNRGTCLYEPPGADAPRKSQGRKLSERRRFPESEFAPNRAHEVQYEA